MCECISLALFGIHSGGDEHICLWVWQVEWWCLLLCASGPLYSKIQYEEKPLAATAVSCITEKLSFFGFVHVVCQASNITTRHMPSLHNFKWCSHSLCWTWGPDPLNQRCSALLQGYTPPTNRIFGFQPLTFKIWQICTMELSDNYTVFKNMWNMGDNSMPCTMVYHFQHLCLLMEQYIMWCVKVKLSLYLPWRHSRSRGTAPLILNLNKSKDEWAGSYPNWFLLIICWTRDWVWPTAFFVCFREEENLLSRLRNETQITQPTACLFTALTTLSWLNLHDT